MQSRGVYVAAFYNDISNPDSAKALLINLSQSDASTSPIFIMIFIIIICILTGSFLNRTFGWTSGEQRALRIPKILLLSFFKPLLFFRDQKQQPTAFP